jgi:hypothetical protein
LDFNRLVSIPSFFYSSTFGCCLEVSPFGRFLFIMASENAGGCPRFLLAGDEVEAIPAVALTSAAFLAMTIVPSLPTS